MFGDFLLTNYKKFDKKTLDALLPKLDRQYIESFKFPASFEFEIGKTIRLSDPQGRQINANIVEIGESDIRLDLNHPLAGKELNFKATIVDLRMATEDELAAGRLGGGGCSSCGSGSGDGCGGGCG